MLKHLQEIITDYSCIPNRLVKIVSQYIMFLMLDHSKHTFRTAANLFAVHESNFSRLLSKDQIRKISRECLNRTIRRRLAKIKTTDEVFLIIDATLTHRASKDVENCQKFRHNGNQYTQGHQFTNFILLINDEVIPLASVPFYTKKYCKQLGIAYQTEIEMVSTWIEMLPTSGLLPASILDKLHFLLDSGYDARVIENVIHEIGAKFTIGLRSDRSVNGLRVTEYFQRHRRIPWRTIRFKLGNGRGKNIERKFRVRTVKKAHLKGFGEVQVICSEKLSRSARKVSRKHIVTNDLHQSTRKIVQIYAKRWTIETWHKEMKQKFGFGDCRAQKFSAVEAHVNFTLCAYCFIGLSEAELPKKGTTLDQYRASQEWKQAAKVINLFDGRKRLKTLAHEELSRVVNG